ncbi:geranylgeranyl reductase family [Mariprofundus ferrinatatus]|uniref:Geranylgeranyl reductase family n=1 Tax=Mariprofundus ferrinatatus TaxID=1921087 RepID=A0A2K8L5X9_9PROT|nr:geranylgeranyl reductase family protein [Mariprofundus ferrinatatus]ATX82730.1 geranylgeranyl reductase family [Mariprofundus ferrinatatus]
MTVYDVAVVGTGPAGATAARELALQGISVALIEKDRLPRHKVCGGGITWRARTLLDFEIEPVVRSECHTALMSLAKSGATFKSTHERPIVSMVMRADFDRLLVEKATCAGAELIEGCRVDGAEFHDDEVLLQTSLGPVRAGFVIAADGATSTMARLAGWERLEQLIPALELELPVATSEYKRFEDCARFDFDMPANGYGWVFPKGDHLGVGIGGFGPGERKTDLKKELRSYLDKLKLSLPQDQQMHGYVIPLMPRKSGFVRRRVFLVGDAAGLADPMSAEGIWAAILSGRMAAEALVKGGLDSAMSSEHYERSLAGTLLPELEAGRKLARLFYSSQTLRKWLLKHYGQRMTEKVADIFMGSASYSDYADAFMRKLKLK